MRRALGMVLVLAAIAILSWKIFFPGFTSKPIPADGFRVLIVHETSQDQKLPAEQLAIYTAREVREYLAAKCAKDQGGNPDFRLLDKDAEMQYDHPHWQAAMKREFPSLPWLALVSESGSYDGPLPGNVDDMMSLLKKYGG